MSTFEIPVEEKSLQKGLRDRSGVFAGQLMPETQPAITEHPPQSLEEMAAAVPPSSTTQVNSEKAPRLRTTDFLTETAHPQTWSTVPGANAEAPAPQSEAAPVELAYSAGGGGGGAGGSGAGGSATQSSTPDETWSLAQLQAEASERGLPTSGTKADLIQRLTA